MDKQEQQLGKLSSPYTTKSDRRATCICVEGSNCYSRKGKSFQLRGTVAWSGRHVAVHLDISVAGSCSGTPRKLRADAASASPATVKDKKHVQRAMSELRDAGETVTPTRVARKLAGAR